MNEGAVFMSLQQKIYNLRIKENLSQEKFAELIGVSKQAVQKWETGVSMPTIDKLVEIAKRFNVSLDLLILDRDSRMMQDLKIERIIDSTATSHTYTNDIMIEFKQCMDEGLDVKPYKTLFEAVAKMPPSNEKENICENIFRLVNKLGIRKGYPYKEPSTLHEIRALQTPFTLKGKTASGKVLEEKIYGAWMGRICGCLLGKKLECTKLKELIPYLKEAGNYPLHRYPLSTDITPEQAKKYIHHFGQNFWYADVVDGMPADDDTNYMVIYYLALTLHNQLIHL